MDRKNKIVLTIVSLLLVAYAFNLNYISEEKDLGDKKPEGCYEYYDSIYLQKEVTIPEKCLNYKYGDTWQTE